MANVNVLFFGATSEAVGSKRIQISLDEGRSVGLLLKHLKERHPGLEGRSLLVAVNQEYAVGEATLNEGDEVAIFTAVSGG
jgi:sulfur-carrier protein